jgi:hypothetical protein
MKSSNVLSRILKRSFRLATGMAGRRKIRKAPRGRGRRGERKRSEAKRDLRWNDPGLVAQGHRHSVGA